MGTYYIHPEPNMGTMRMPWEKRVETAGQVVMQPAPKMMGHHDQPIVLSSETHRLGCTGSVKWRCEVSNG